MATTTRQNKEIVRRFLNAWNDGDLERIDAIVADDAEHHDPTDPPDLPPGPAGEKRLYEAHQAAFPDVTLEIEAMIAEGARVATRWTARGAHEGEFMGVEPTGTEVEITGFQIDRLEDGQIVEKRVLHDALGLLQQLGAVPDRSDE